MTESTVLCRDENGIREITINRPHCRNAVDRATATALADAFRQFDAREDLCVAILTGSGGHFCAGADLKAVSRGQGNRVEETGDGPMGPTRMMLSKPVIAAIEGYAVAGGLELAIWCDLRVCARDAVFGVYCRRFGVPLIDGGTLRLPRLIGHGRAMDMILTGRSVDAGEALQIGLTNRVADPGAALSDARQLASQLMAFPQQCLRADRLSAHQQWDLSITDALKAETRGGLNVLASGETLAGAGRFAEGAGRHGRTPDESAQKG